MIKILTDPLIAFGLTIIIVFVLLIIYKFFKIPSEKFFLINELILIIIGLIGILAIISKNQDIKNNYEIQRLENQIIFNFRFSEEHLNENYYCFKFIKSDLFTEQEFNEKQRIRNKTCEWVKNVKNILANTNINDFKKIPKLPIIDNDILSEYPNVIYCKGEISRTNELISKRNNITKKYKGINILNNINETIGLIILLISLSIKFTEIIYKIRKNNA